MGDANLGEHIIGNPGSPGARKIWSQLSISGVPACIVVFLDAELYIERVNATSVVRALQQDQSIPSTLAIYLSNNGSAARHADFTCNEQFAAFVATDVLAWLRETFRLADSVPIMIAGLSLSGLAAAYIALRYPDRFSAAICQSPSFWWEGERFRGSLPLAEFPSVKLWISVGELETTSGVSHPPSGLLQQSSQVDSCRRTYETLLSRGHHAQHRIFNGGHDPECWREDLRSAMAWALG